MSNLDDIGVLYTCEQWGAFENSNAPTIITDGGGYSLLEVTGFFTFPAHLLITKEREIFMSIDGLPTESELQSHITSLMNLE